MRFSALLVASLSILTFTACPGPGGADGGDGGPPPDFCNTRQEADSDATNCQLTVTSGGAEPSKKTGLYLSKLADGGTDNDWYVAQLPALTPRSLVHINGGYLATQSAVNFQVNVLKDGASGLTSLATGVDHHAGGAQPRPVDLIFPFSESNAKLYLLVKDEGSGGQAHFDNRNTYSLFAEVTENPDVNEPNDETPTEIALTAGANGQQGETTGYLATADDVDLFELSVASASRQIVYLHLTEVGDHPTNPPPAYQLAYTLYDPSGTPISEGNMSNAYLPINLATARLSTAAGAYRVKVSGYHPPNDTTPVNGDLRVQYKLEVVVLPDLDAQEPNDTADEAKPLTLAANGSVSVTSRLSYVGDTEWFTVTLPSHATPSVLRYRVTGGTTGGRFAPLTTTPLRQIDVVQPVTTGATAADQTLNCKQSRSLCPRSGDGSTAFLDSYCEANTPPQCLWAHREEEPPRIINLRNLVGALPVPVGQASTYLFSVKDQGVGASKYADDRDLTLTLEWADDADEAARTGGPQQVSVSGAPVVASGQLTFGYGGFLDDGEAYFTSSNGLRASADYDAITSDKDLFQFNVSATGDQTWNLGWELLYPDGGTAAPGELALEMVFCTGLGSAPDGGICVGQSSRVFAYSDDKYSPWYLDPPSFSTAVELFSRTDGSQSTTYTALPIGCECLSSARLAPGAYFLNVSALHRTAPDPLVYRITQSISAFSCPGADAGAMCGFAP